VLNEAPPRKIGLRQPLYLLESVFLSHAYWVFPSLQCFGFANTPVSLPISTRGSGPCIPQPPFACQEARFIPDHKHVNIIIVFIMIIIFMKQVKKDDMLKNLHFQIGVSTWVLTGETFIKTKGR
jgi:hypothetical protein